MIIIISTKPLDKFKNELKQHKYIKVFCFSIYVLHHAIWET